MSRPQVLTLALMAVLGSAIVWQAPQAFVDGGREISETHGASKQARRLAPVRGQDLPTEVFTGAESTIPPHASYHVVVGPNLPLTEQQWITLGPLLHHWLLPRRHVDDLEAAQWVIAYGEPTETIDAPLSTGVEVSPGVVVAEVER